MITVCKTCGSIVDETVERCKDCHTPNPWFDPATSPDAFDKRPAAGIVIDLMTGRHSNDLDRSLLTFAALTMAVSVALFVISSVNEWSGLSVLFRISAFGLPLMLSRASLWPIAPTCLKGRSCGACSRVFSS